MLKQSCIAIGLFATAGLGLAKTGPVMVDAPIEKIFIPHGFDDNDNVEVVIHGKFPSSCYNVGQASATVNEETQEVEVEANAIYYSDAFCIQSVTPFIETIKLGVLPKGEFKVRMKDKPDVNNVLRVKERTTESPDDNLYAPVENANIEVDWETGKQALRVQGKFPYMFIGCMVMKEIQTVQNSSDTLVVLPIAEIVDGEACAEQPDDRSYEITTGLSQPFYGEGLLHVRTLHSTSLNRFIDIQQ